MSNVDTKRGCIVVTGASRGIGAAIALELVKQGHCVVCASRSGALPINNLTQETQGRLIEAKTDVTDSTSLQSMFQKLANDGWEIRGLVNNAGFHVDAPSADLSLDEWHQVMNTNATSVVSACQAAYPHFVAAGGGVIVNIGSFFDKLGVKRNLAYCASKAAVGAITRVLAVEWASKGIKVIDIAPGYIVTDLNADAMAVGGPLRAYLDKRIPGRHPGTAADVGALVAAMFTAAGSFMTGETIYIDGGQGIAH